MRDFHKWVGDSECSGQTACCFELKELGDSCLQVR